MMQLFEGDRIFGPKKTGFNLQIQHSPFSPSVAGRSHLSFLWAKEA
jgi:hypothetical protein